MFWKRTRYALLAGMVLASAALMAQANEADDKKADDKGEKLDKPAEKKDGTGTVPTPAPAYGDCGGCGPSYRTIWVTEYRREAYEATRTVYTTAYRDEAYTAYREECVPEVRTRTCTTYHRVPEYRDVVRCVTEYVPSCETRTVFEKHTVCRQVTEYRTKCVDRGHYECQEVPVTDWFAGFRKKSCGGCGDCCNTCEPCQRTRTKRVWVSCMTTESYPVCRTVHETVCTPRTVTVNVCKPVTRQVVEKVCTYKCVPECKTETYTVNVRKCVAFQATRKVAFCVPSVEKYTATRCVPVQVAKQVPVAECCECAAPARRFSFNLFSRKHSCGSECNSCSSGCGSSHGCGCGH
jgi:hypothetical protein